MARVRKVPLIKGKKRVVFHSGEPEVVQSLFCGECEMLTQSATIQIGKQKADRENISRTVIVGRACANSEDHKDGKKYLWPVEGWVVPRV